VLHEFQRTTCLVPPGGRPRLERTDSPHRLFGKLYKIFTATPTLAEYPLARDKDAMEATLAESSEVVRHLESQLESVTAQLTDTTAHAETAQLRLVEQAEQIGSFGANWRPPRAPQPKLARCDRNQVPGSGGLEARLKSTAQKRSPAHK
jgi:hypothetical protein